MLRPNLYQFLKTRALLAGRNLAVEGRCGQKGEAAETQALLPAAGRTN